MERDNRDIALQYRGYPLIGGAVVVNYDLMAVMVMAAIFYD